MFVLPLWSNPETMTRSRTNDRGIVLLFVIIFILLLLNSCASRSYPVTKDCSKHQSQNRKALNKQFP